MAYYKFIVIKTGFSIKIDKLVRQKQNPETSLYIYSLLTLEQASGYFNGEI